ncbi:MAG: ATP-binding cassette domain-containing protein [Candidatus Marinimicrobia bacterium]|nr:ATP-binding cassette domain-containing protein [Candidatus Neomarinimicrobiota bacterium]
MGEPIIDLQDIKKEYKNKKIAINSLTIYPNVIYQIQGDNDSGKTLLMDIIAHEKKQDSGTIIFDNKSSKKNEYSRSLTKKNISYLKENNSFWRKKTVLKYLTNTLKAQKISSINAYSETMSILEKFDLKKYASVKRNKLSDGTFRKIELLNILLEKKDIILLDEPFLKIDDSFVKKFNYHIKNIIKENKKVIIISSAKSFAKYRMIKILLRISDGNIVKVEKPGSHYRPAYKKKKI